jgi:hypothetical protein
VVAGALIWVTVAGGKNGNGRSFDLVGGREGDDGDGEDVVVSIEEDGGGFGGVVDAALPDSVAVPGPDDAGSRETVDEGKGNRG